MSNQKRNAHEGAIPGGCQEAMTLLRQGINIKTKIQGRSMYPLVLPGKDYVTVAPIKGKKIRLGDLVLYRKEAGVLVLKRVCKIDREGCYLAGDRQTVLTGPVKRKLLVGKAIRIEKEKMNISVKNPIYRLYALLMVKLFPYRDKFIK